MSTEEQKDLQSQFNAEDRAALASIGHIPDDKLRENLAVNVAELNKIEAILDEYEGMPPDMTSMETTESRVRALRTALAESQAACKVKDGWFKNELVRLKLMEALGGPREESIRNMLALQPSSTALDAVMKPLVKLLKDLLAVLIDVIGTNSHNSKGVDYDGLLELEERTRAALAQYQKNKENKA